MSDFGGRKRNDRQSSDKRTFKHKGNHSDKKSRFEPALKAEKYKNLDEASFSNNSQFDFDVPSDSPKRSMQKVDYSKDYFDKQIEAKNVDDQENIKSLTNFPKDHSEDYLQNDSNEYNNKMEIETDDKDEPLTDMSFNVSKDKRALTLDNYQIPFLSQRHKVKELDNFEEYSSTHSELFSSSNTNREVEVEDDDVLLEEIGQSKRFEYKPSFTPRPMESIDQKATEEDISVEENDKDDVYVPALTQEEIDAEITEDNLFVPKTIPKPYRDSVKTSQNVDGNLRELAKRLVKTKDMFLLFE